MKKKPESQRPNPLSSIIFAISFFFLIITDWLLAFAIAFTGPESWLTTLPEIIVIVPFTIGMTAASIVSWIRKEVEGWDVETFIYGLVAIIFWIIIAFNI